MVIQGIYASLADVDDTNRSQPLLKDMASALDQIDGANELKSEIASWLMARERVGQRLFDAALIKYNEALEFNDRNPATLYERAKVLIRLSVPDYKRALDDLERVIAFAQGAPAPESTPTPSATDTLTPIDTLIPPEVTRFPTPTQPLMATITLAPDATVVTPASSPAPSVTPGPTRTPTPSDVEVVSPIPFVSQFATAAQMISAVRKVINDNPELARLLANVTDSEYNNLREFGLVPIEAAIEISGTIVGTTVGQIPSVVGEFATQLSGGTSLTQTVLMPVGNPLLTMSYRPLAEQTTPSTLYVRIDNRVACRFIDTNQTVDPVSVTCDLRAYAGQEVRLGIEYVAPSTSELSRPSPAWNFGVCLAGVGNADANVWHEPTFQDAIKAARLEAIKLVPLSDNDKMNKVYTWLRSQGIAFVMVRLTWKPDPAWASLPASERMEAAVRSFVDGTRGQLEFAYAKGVRYFEVHNGPNITANPTDPIGDGLGTAWMGPDEFAEWFSRVTDELRKIHGDIFLGFPGLAPRATDFADFGDGLIRVNGQPLNWNTDEWLSVSMPVIDEKADWIGVHVYWQFEGSGLFGMENLDAGSIWKRYQARFPNKMLMITEFSNNGDQVDLATKGRQYANYIAMLRNEKSIGAAFAGTLYWATDQNREGWVFVDEQGTFRVTELPGAMGAAMAANPLTAIMVAVNEPSIWLP